MNVAKIREVLEEIKQESFVKGYEASDVEAMGLLVSKYFDWNGIAILDTASYACEDANFHTEASKIGEMINHINSFNK